MINIFGILALMSVASLITTTGLDQSAHAESATAEIDNTVKINNQKYMVHLTLCAGNESITSPSIIVYSLQDAKEISVNKVLPANTCQSYEVTIQAKHANKIGVLVN